MSISNCRVDSSLFSACCLVLQVWPGVRCAEPCDESGRPGIDRALRPVMRACQPAGQRVSAGGGVMWDGGRGAAGALPELSDLNVHDA
jgi:hypothetical protein